MNKPDVTSQDALLLNTPEYAKRFWKLIQYFIIYAIVITVISVALTLIFSGLTSEANISSTLKSTTSTAAGLASPLSIDESGIHATIGSDSVSASDEEKDTSEADRKPLVFESRIFAFFVFEAILIACTGFIFSGAYAGIFLRPINPIKFAPFMLLIGDNLRIRFWICYPDGKFLHNVTISLKGLYKKRYRDSTILFSSNKIESNSTTVQEDSYTMIRGVWDIEIPIGSETFKRLRRILSNKEDQQIQVLIQGETDSGEFVGLSRSFNMRDVLSGYAFAAYHYPDYDEANEETLDEDVDRGHRPWFANFYKVVPFASIEASLASSETIVNADRVGIEASIRHSRIEGYDNEALKAVGIQLAEDDTGNCCAPEISPDYIASPASIWKPRLSFHDLKMIWKL